MIYEQIMQPFSMGYYPAYDYHYSPFFCLLIMAISQGVLARWSHLIWLCKDHSTEVVLSLKGGGLHYPNEKQAREEADLSEAD